MLGWQMCPYGELLGAPWGPLSTTSPQGSITVAGVSYGSSGGSSLKKSMHCLWLSNLYRHGDLRAATALRSLFGRNNFKAQNQWVHKMSLSDLCADHSVRTADWLYSVGLQSRLCVGTTISPSLKIRAESLGVGPSLQDAQKISYESLLYSQAKDSGKAYQARICTVWTLPRLRP